ncbi:MAG: response regulator, partial [Aggregatilineales bacterium]
MARILVVDDDAMNREVMEAFLMTEDYHIDLAHSGKQALRLLSAFTPDLIILDVNMPDMNGYEVCRRIRAEKQLSTPRIMIVTGYKMEDEFEKGQAAGADAFLSRPFDG